VRPDARPQARENRRRIRWNTLRIFRAENDADGCGSFAAVEWSMSDRLLARMSHERVSVAITDLPYDELSDGRRAHRLLTVRSEYTTDTRSPAPCSRSLAPVRVPS
jgi:hypothetical protein